MTTPGSDARARLAAEGLVADAWSNGPNDRYAPHAHGYDKVIVVAEGGIVFALDDGRQTIALFSGDRLELPAGTMHGALVSPMGVTCLEAHLPAGSLSEGTIRRAAGAW